MRLRTARLVPLLLLCGLSLPACAVPSPPPALSRGLTECQAQPPAPDDPSDAELAEWILATVEAGEDCRGRLAGVREVLLP